MKQSLGILLVILGMTRLGLANPMHSASQEGFKSAKEMQQSALHSIESSKLLEIPSFQAASPNESSYYDGNPSALNHDAAHFTNDASDFISSSKAKRKHFRFEFEADPIFTRSLKVLDENPQSQSSDGGFSDNIEVHSCIESLEPKEAFCTQTKRVTAHMNKGALKFVYRCADTHCNGRRNPGCACKWWQKVPFGYDCTGTNRKNQCSDEGFTGQRPYMWPGVGTPPPDEYEPDQYIVDSETLEDNCEHLEALSDRGKCVYKSKTCTQGPETRVINGVRVYQSCWQYKYLYACDAEQNAGCKALRDRGCFQVGSVCHETKNGNCVSYKQTYHCRNHKTTKSNDLSKLSTQMFCQDGACSSPSYSPNQDMFEAISKLQTLKEMQKDLTGNPLHIFSGKEHKCTKSVTNFSDCCSLEGGWGKVVGDQCKAEEKQLAQLKSSGSCHLIGTHCAEKSAGVCLRKATSYCCFPSKLARIFQQQARQQLRLSWGSADKPDCRGLTVAELSQVDFSKIDTTELFSDIAARFRGEKSKNLQTKSIESIRHNMKQMQNGARHEL